MNNMNLFGNGLRTLDELAALDDSDENEVSYNNDLIDEGALAVSLEFEKRYEIKQDMLRYYIISIPSKDCTVSNFKVYFGYGLEHKYVDLITLRRMIPYIEDYDMTYKCYMESFKGTMKYVENLGKDFENTINKMNISSSDKNIIIASLELEGLILKLYYCTDSKSYEYMVCKKIDIDKWENIGFINYEPNLAISNINMFNVLKSYAREHRLFFSKINYTDEVKPCYNSNDEIYPRCNGQHNNVNCNECKLNKN